MRVTIPGAAADMLMHSELKREHPDTWGRYLNQTIKVSGRKGIRVTVDLTPNDLMCLVKYLEDKEMVKSGADWAADHAVSAIYASIRDHRGDLQSADPMV